MAPQAAESGRLPPSSAAMSRESTLEISLRTTRNEAGQFGTKGDVVPPLLSEQERGGGGKAGFPGDSRRGSVNGFANGTGGSGTSANEIRDSRRPSAASSTGTSSSTRSLGSVWRAIKSRTTSGSTTATTPESTPTMSKIKTFLSSAGRPTTSTSTSREQTTDPRSSAIAEVTSAERAPNARRRPATSAGGGAAGDRARSFFGAATSGQTTGGSISGPPRLGSVRASDHALDGTEQKWKNPFANARPSTSAGSQTLSSSRSFMRRRSTQPDTSFTSNNLAAPSAQSTTSTRRPSAATGAPGPPGLVRALSFSTMKSSRTPSQPHDGKEELTERLPLRLKSITSVRNLRPGSSRKRDEEVKERSGRPRVSRLPSLAGSVPIEAAAARSADSTFVSTTSPAPPATTSFPTATAPLSAREHVRQKSSISALRSILRHPSSSNVSSANVGDAEDPLTDEELASWKLGRSRESSVGDAGIEGVKKDEARRILANGNGEGATGGRASGSRRGSAEDDADVLDTQKTQAAFVDPPSSPRPSGLPLSPALRGLPFGSLRRPSAGLRRPKTAPDVRPCRPRRSSDASGAFNVLEFVAADEGRDTKAALPMRFPQMAGDDAVFLPSAITSPNGATPFPSANGNRRKLARRPSSASSHLSLGSEEGMILSTLDGGNLSHPSSPSSAGGSPVMFQSGFAPSVQQGAGESALPPSMRGLFATPGAPQRIRPRTAAGEIPLSVPSRRAAKLPPSPIKIPTTVPAVSASPDPIRPSSTTGSTMPLRRPTSSPTLRSPTSPKTPAPPRPPRAPSRPSSLSPTSPTFAQHRAASQAWSSVSFAKSSRAGTPTPPARHPRSSTSIGREKTVATLEGRPGRTSGESQRVEGGTTDAARRYTPPPSPPPSEGPPVKVGGRV